MSSATEFVQGVTIDICSRSFMLYGDEGNEKFIECDNAEEFMSILEVCTSHLNEDQISYKEIY